MGTARRKVSFISCLAARLQGMALIGAVDCNDQKASGNLCQRFEIKGFPTIKVGGEGWRVGGGGSEWVAGQWGSGGGRSSLDWG